MMDAPYHQPHEFFIIPSLWGTAGPMICFKQNRAEVMWSHTYDCWWPWRSQHLHHERRSMWQRPLERSQKRPSSQESEKKWSPESHHHKEMNSVSNLNGPERRSFPSWALKWEHGLADALIASAWDPEPRTQLSSARTPDLWGLWANDRVLF